MGRGQRITFSLGLDEMLAEPNDGSLPGWVIRSGPRPGPPLPDSAEALAAYDRIHRKREALLQRLRDNIRQGAGEEKIDAAIAALARHDVSMAQHNIALWLRLLPEQLAEMAYDFEWEKIARVGENELIAEVATGKPVFGVFAESKVLEDSWDRVAKMLAMDPHDWLARVGNPELAQRYGDAPEVRSASFWYAYFSSPQANSDDYLAEGTEWLLEQVIAQRIG